MEFGQKKKRDLIGKTIPHTHKVTEDSNVGMEAWSVYNTTLHPQFQNLHKQPNGLHYRQKIPERGRADAKMADKRFLYKRLKPSLEAFEREGHKRDG